MKKYVIAIDLGGTNLKAALINRKLRIVNKIVLDTRRAGQKDKILKALCLAIEAIIKESRLRKEAVIGIGVGLPGPVDYKRGIAHFLPNIPGYCNFSLKKTLAQITGLPVFVDNDAKLMCLAEHRLGSARGLKNVLCVTLGTGVGGAFILNSRLFRGSDNAAGEIGHLPINQAGPRCNCAGSACLEAYVGNRRLEAQAQRVFGKKIGLQELASLARRGSKRAKAIWSRAGRRLGIAFTGAANLLNLDAVVIGGGVAAAGSLLFAPLKKTVKSRAMMPQVKRMKILKARLGPQAGLIGAAIMVLESPK